MIQRSRGESHKFIQLAGRVGKMELDGSGTGSLAQHLEHLQPADSTPPILEWKPCAKKTMLQVLDMII